jgi:predicted RNase H-like HicB family nuclease
MTSDDWEMLAEAELTHDTNQAAYEVSKLTPRERSTPGRTYAEALQDATDLADGWVGPPT